MIILLTSGLDSLEFFTPKESVHVGGSSRDDRDAEILRDRDCEYCGVRCDNRVLLRESGAQSNIPPLYAVIRHHVAREKSYRSINAASNLDYIITSFI